MHFALVALAAIAPLAVQAADIAVAVGQGGLTFAPNSITAAPGDNIIFSFYPKNHTVTQSSFDAPCTPNANGVGSGYRFVESGVGAETYTYTVNGTGPAWFYCAQGNHCTSGMVFAVNPTAERTFAAFQAAAQGGTAPAGGNTTTNSTTGAPGPSATNTTTGGNTTTTGAPKSSAMGLSISTWPLLAVAGLVGIAL